MGNLPGLMTAIAKASWVAIGGQVCKDLYRLTHQSTNSVALFNSITKYSSVQDPNNISEIIANASAANGAKRRCFCVITTRC